MFNEQQILAAIRDPNHVNDPASGNPFGVPWGCANAPSMAAAEFSYMGVYPRGPVLLEVHSFAIQSFAAEPIPDVFLTVAARDLIASMRTFQDPLRACIMLDDPSGPRFCLSTGESGRLSVASNPAMNNVYSGNRNAELVRLRDSVVLYGQSKPNMLIAISSGVNTRFVATFHGREWPLDPANYSP